MIMQNKRDTKKLSVMQVLPHLNSGGLVSGAVEIATALKKNNYNSIVVSNGGYKENEILRNNSILERLPVHSKNIFKLFHNKKKLIELIVKYNVNIIHARSRAPAWSAYLAAKELNIPLITTFHGTYGIENILKKKYNSIMLKSEAVIAISNFIKLHIENNYNHKNNLYVIPRGVNMEIFSPKKVSSARLISAAKKIKIEGDDKIILLPGRLTKWKGHKIAIKAVARLNFEKFKLVIIGDTQGRLAYKDELISLVGKLNLHNKVIFLEQTRDLAAYLMLADLVLSCSIKPEAFGRTILEAQAMGRPVLAFDHGGSVELVKKNENGLLSAVGNIHELSTNINKILKFNYNERKALSRRSIANVKKKYLTEFMCKKTINLYKKIIRDFNFDEKSINN